MYTVEDLEAAREDLRKWMDRFADYSGNNPDKYSADIKSARSTIRLIEGHLKSAGVLPLAEQEQLEKELDAAYPNAQSKEIVEHNGRNYQRRFFPLEKSRSKKTVAEWGRSWTDVTGHAK